MFINMINIKWLWLHTNFLHFCYILVHNFMDYILNLCKKKPGNTNYVCMVTCLRRLAASCPSCLLSCRTTSQRITSMQLPAADGAVVDGGLFANSFLSKFSMLSMLYWESGSDDQILSAIILDLWSRFLLRVSTSSRHIQCNFAFTHFLWVAVGCSVILGRIAPALLQATTEGSITWNHEQLWWSQASELCHYVPVMLPAVQTRKAAWLQCGPGGCCSAAGDNGNGNRRWSAYKWLTKDPAVTTCH